MTDDLEKKVRAEMGKAGKANLIGFSKQLLQTATWAVSVVDMAGPWMDLMNGYYTPPKTVADLEKEIEEAAKEASDELDFKTEQQDRWLMISTIESARREKAFSNCIIAQLEKEPVTDIQAVNIAMFKGRIEAADEILVTTQKDLEVTTAKLKAREIERQTAPLKAELELLKKQQAEDKEDEDPPTGFANAVALGNDDDGPPTGLGNAVAKPEDEDGR